MGDNEVKPRIIPLDDPSQHHMPNILFDHQRRDQQMNFAQYNTIKHENKEILMDQDDQSSVKSYHDLSIIKKQKLE